MVLRLGNSSAAQDTPLTQEVRTEKLTADAEVERGRKNWGDLMVGWVESAVGNGLPD